MTNRLSIWCKAQPQEHAQKDNATHSDYGMRTNAKVTLLLELGKFYQYFY